MFTYPLVATLLSILAVQETPVPEPAPRIEVGAHVKGYYRFDWIGENVSGAPHTVAINRIVFRFTKPGGEPAHWVTIDRPVTVGEVRVTFADALRGIPRGDWDIDVKLVDAAGQHGNYSARLERKVVVLKPRPAAVQNFGTVFE